MPRGGGGGFRGLVIPREGVESNVTNDKGRRRPLVRDPERGS